MVTTTLIRSATIEAPAVVVRGAAGAAVELEATGSLFGRLVPWGVEADVSDDGGRTHYRESFRRGGTLPTGPLPVFFGHTAGRSGVERGPLIGRLEALEDRDDGLYGRVILADTASAREARSLADVVGAYFSVEFTTPGRPADGSVVERSAWSITGVAVLTAPARGAYPGAEVLSVRADPPEGDEDEDDDEDQGDEVDEGDEGAAADPVAARVRLEREVRRILGRVAGPRPQPHPLARFTGAFEFYESARASASDELPHLFRDGYQAHRERVSLARAFVDQITTDNPGVMPPAWLTEIFGILDMGRPVINAIGTRPLPPSGMEVDWPYFDGDLHALVGQQLTEKADITSVKVSFKKASTAIKTYAGGSDISWQLIRRSQPAYRDAYLRILNIAYGVVTDNVVGDTLPAVVGAQTVDYDVTAPDADGAALKAAVFQASSLVQIATGAPASYVLAATDVFQAFGAMPAMVASPYGTQNVPGTATASTLDVNISGLSVTHAPDLAPGTAIVSNSLACAWMEDGPFVVAAPVVPKLGEDVAIWGMGAFAAFIPAGIVLLSNTVVAADADQTTTGGARKK
jgi:hypothetical protein